MSDHYDRYNGMENLLCTDAISRQAAIVALDEQIRQCDKALSSSDISMRDEFAVKVERASLVAFRETLEYLPSAEPEIIRCAECKWFQCNMRQDGYLPKGVDEFECRHWCGYCDPTDFCSYAERRENE